MTKGAFGLDILELQAPAERNLMLLRCLGRLEYMNTAQMKALIYPDMQPQNMRHHLRTLWREDLIWRLQVAHQIMPPRPGPGKQAPPMKEPHVYGLTHHGRVLLETIEAEHDQRSLDGLRYRDPRGRNVSHITLRHDLQVSRWCSSILAACRHNLYVQSIFVQVEFTVHERQRIDAVIVLRVTETPRQSVEIAPYFIPFFDGTPRRPDEREIRLAFENDRGTEPLPILMGKAATYRDLTASGVYNRVFGGPILPVFLVPTARRAGQIAKEWQRMWKDGWGAISTPRQAEHPQHGALWGGYLDMMTSQPFSLMTTLTQHASTNKVEFLPLLTVDQWQRAAEACR